MELAQFTPRVVGTLEVVIVAAATPVGEILAVVIPAEETAEETVVEVTLGVATPEVAIVAVGTPEEETVVEVTQAVVIVAVATREEEIPGAGIQAETPAETAGVTEEAMVEETVAAIVVSKSRRKAVS